MAASADARSQPKSPAGCNFLMYEQAHGPYPHVEQRSDGTAELPVGVIVIPFEARLSFGEFR